MQLHPDLSFCRIEDRFVFLDLSRDRYFTLGESLAEVFAAALAGDAGPDDWARLAEQGITAPKDGRPLTPCPPALPSQSLLDLLASPPSTARLASLAWAFTRMRATLRRHGLARTTAALADARRAMVPADTDDALIASAMAYDRLAVLRGTHDLCLPHALALAIHLVRRGYAAEVVFGVQLRPFSAHCWVEQAGWLVNDRLDRVRFYTPIRRL